MKNIPIRLAIIVAVCLLCVWSLYAKPVRFGKDLRGGVSLIYSVKMGEGAQREQVLGQTIDVLKNRINPNGVLDIGMQPQGLDRIEVVMPLPSPEVLALQRDYNEALKAFMKDAIVSPTELDQALAAGQAPERFGVSGPRGDDIKELQRAFNDEVAAKAELERARAAAADAASISEIENRLVKASLDVGRLKNKLLGVVLNQARLVKALGLSDVPTPDRDPAGEIIKNENGDPKLGASPRDRELDAIRSEFPHLAPRIAGLVTLHDAYMLQRTGLDDPEDLMRLMRGAGVLQFHIAVSPSDPVGVNIEDMREQLAKRGPRNVESGRVRWFEINDLKQWYESPEQLEQLQRDPRSYFAERRLVVATYAGSYYVLLYTSDDKAMVHSSGDEWALQRVYRTQDQRLGGAAVGFQLDQSGAGRMGRMTGVNVGQPMAIVLDNQVYSAPNLQSQISGSGVITGNFSESEVSYLIRVLAAGSLSASISPDPISVNILGPSIGADNLVKGREAILISVGVTCVVMVLYYFLAGIVACIAISISTLMIFGIMGAIDGTFTLPGLAGIALAIAMGVDANILIYERIREEISLRGESLRDAIELGFRRALSAIVDSNITNLIAVVVLYKVGATEVKGFALTMCIGVIGTLFTGLFVTKTLFMVMTDWFGIKKLPMLPTVFPAVSRAVTPSVDWVSMRKPVWVLCAIVAVVSLVLTFARGRDIFETEFRGGVAMTLSTRDAQSGDPSKGKLILKRSDVEDRVRAVGTKAGAGEPIVYELRNANVLTVGESNAEGESSRFQIRVGNPPSGVDDEAQITRRVVEAVVLEFKDQLTVQLPLTFLGSSTDTANLNHAPHTFPLDKDVLGESIRRPDIKEPLGDFRGGVAVLVESIDPPVQLADVENRIARLRSQPDFSDTAGRRVKAVGVTPADPANPAKGYSTVAVLVSDPSLSSLTADFDAWDKQLAAVEWILVRSALIQPASLDEISSFSPIVAENLAASAIVAVILSMIGMLAYIWVRFGSFRFSAAAVMSLTFNVVCCLGFVAVAPWLAGTAFGRATYVDEFRIDINVIAALLAIVGYAINDTIVILDRIRENRGKLPYVSATCVNDSVNQTFSRTLLTGGLTFATAVILVVLGGTGIRSFAYTFGIGLIAGTISSVVIAAPMVYSRREEETARRREELGDVVPAALTA
ncbi:MAG: protein translocase subunit SecD [Phycisphaerae bacterium]|nr:protein translocase subunit SecD [Phycisphaerae bacterium]